MLTNTRSKPACSGNCNKLVVFHVRQGHGTARARGVQVDVSAIIEASFPQLASRLQWLVRPHVFRLKCLVLYLFKIVAKGKVLQSQYIERVALGTLHRNEHKETDTLSGRRTMLWVQSSQGSFRFFFFLCQFLWKVPSATLSSDAPSTSWAPSFTKVYSHWWNNVDLFPDLVR